MAKLETQIAIVGAGPAGLAAAEAAARAGAQVVLLDAYARPGGQYYKQLAPGLTSAQLAAMRAHLLD